VGHVPLSALKKRDTTKFNAFSKKKGLKKWADGQPKHALFYYLLICFIAPQNLLKTFQ
jgi:hypothetical protein